MRTVLKPMSLMRQTTASKFWVIALGPCHSPSVMVEDVSKPNQLTPLIVSVSPFAPARATLPHLSPAGLYTSILFALYISES